MVTTTAIPTSRPTSGSREARAIASAARITAGVAPSSSGTPAIAATTRPGKSEWASDSAA